MRLVWKLGALLAVMCAGFGLWLWSGPGITRSDSMAVSVSVAGKPVLAPKAPSLAARWYGAAPYVTPLYGNPPNLPQVMSATGQKTFELASILAPNTGGCTPTWDGTADVSSDTTVAGIINSVRSAGGDAFASIGGYDGTKLGQTCGTPSATANAYQQVIDKYGLKALDFNLEYPEIENATAISNELGAAQILQRNNPGLYVSVTTVASTANIDPYVQKMLNTAKTLKFVPNNWSIMPFNGFKDAASQTAALDRFHSALMTTFGWNSATAYAHEGASLMNGRSDFGEYYSPAEFRTILNYEVSHGMTRYTFWSLNRDRQCTPPNNGQTLDTCSSVPQSPWAFTKLTAQFATAK